MSNHKLFLFLIEIYCVTKLINALVSQLHNCTISVTQRYLFYLAILVSMLFASIVMSPAPIHKNL